MHDTVKIPDFEQLKLYTKEQAVALVQREIYYAALIFERMENAGLLHGNGHHMAQDMATRATDMVEERWLGKTEADEEEPSDNEDKKTPPN